LATANPYTGKATLDKMISFLDTQKALSPIHAGFRDRGRELCTNQKAANKRERYACRVFRLRIVAVKKST